MDKMESPKFKKDSYVLRDEENQLKIQKDDACWKFWKKHRIVIAILAFFGFFTLMVLRVNLSIAIIAMTTSDTDEQPEFQWDSRTRGFILSSFFYGYICFQLLGGWLSSRIGGKRVFGYGIGVATLLALLTPPLTRISVYLLIALRVVQGVFEGIASPAISSIWANWAPPLERTRLTTVAHTGSAIAMLVGLPISGIVADHFGWASMFYVSSSLGIFWFVMWMYFVSDRPENDPRISPSELAYLKKTLNPNNDKKVVSHPWKEILKSPAVWAIFAIHFSEAWGHNTMVTQLPSLMRDVLGYKIQKTGIISALPYIATTVTMVISSYLADCLVSKKYLTTTQMRKLLTCGASLLQAIFMTAAGYFCTDPTILMVCIFISYSAYGFAVSGFLVNYLDIAPQHASVLMGFGNTVATISGIISPSLTGYIVKNKSADEWKIVLMIVGIIYLIGALIYGTFASGKRQKWADVLNKQESRRKFLQTQETDDNAD